MKLSRFIEKLTADLETNGDTENVLIGVAVAGDDGKHYRLDAVLTENGADVLRDVNFTNGMACIVANYRGEHQVRAQIGTKMGAHTPSEACYNGPVEIFTGYVLYPGGRIQVDFQAPVGATEAEKAMKFVWALGEQTNIDYLAIGDSDHPLPEFKDSSSSPSIDSNRGA